MVHLKMAKENVDYKKLQTDLEQQELESAGGVAPAQVYNQLLALYLLHNDMCNAKFLWKRIPQTVKSSTPETVQIWAVGQKLWLRDYPGIYEALKKEWSESISQIMEAVKAATRERAKTLVSKAYSSIDADDFAVFMGMPLSEAIQAATQEGWTYDSATKYIKPTKPVMLKDPELLSEQQLSVLTDYVSFLEA
ncbi:COP9 signalosome complex subunit 8-like [Crassostrea angulata]|uniref:COP9 signalosome complex subunit 8-like n=1 Tax=Magallana angulata TaxID=2784310 RepID=UPI0022B0961D|nr:COP9 signalosome complex subunit 8-like [Crassostrea angulata]